MRVKLLGLPQFRELKRASIVRESLALRRLQVRTIPQARLRGLMHSDAAASREYEPQFEKGDRDVRSSSSCRDAKRGIYSHFG